MIDHEDFLKWIITLYFINFVLNLYDLGEWISSVWLKFRFKKKKGSLKKFSMSVAPMSSQMIRAYLSKYLKNWQEKGLGQ